MFMFRPRFWRTGDSAILQGVTPFIYHTPSPPPCVLHVLIRVLDVLLCFYIYLSPFLFLTYFYYLLCFIPTPSISPCADATARRSPRELACPIRYRTASRLTTYGLLGFLTITPRRFYSRPVRRKSTLRQQPLDQIHPCSLPRPTIIEPEATINVTSTNIQNIFQCRIYQNCLATTLAQIERS